MDSVILGAAYFDWLYSALGNVMAFFYALVPSYGFAIAMLTVTVRVLLIPLTAKTVKSQRAMQQLQPELKKLQAKHKGDRQQLNEEMMKLYKEHKANPLSSCLPLLLQMPLFIILYRLIIDLSKVPPRHIPLGSDLYRALEASQGKLESLGMNLAEKPQTVIGVLLVAAVVGTGYFQQKQMTARLPADSINPQMQMVTKIFPVFFGLISLSVPAGVVLYFVVSNVWQIGQQAVAFRNREAPVETEEEPPKALKGGAGGAGTPGKGGGPTKSGGSTAKGGGGGQSKGGGGGTAKAGGGQSKGGGGQSKGGAAAKGGGGAAKTAGARNQGGGGGQSRPPSGRVTPKGGGKTSGRVTPKGGPAAAAKAASGQRGGKAASGSAPRSSGAGSSGNRTSGTGKSGTGKSGTGTSGSGSATQSSDGESRWSRLSPLNRPAKPKRPPPAARPKGLPPTKGSSGGSSRKET